MSALFPIPTGLHLSAQPLPRERPASPRPSPPSVGGEGEDVRALDRLWGNGMEAAA
jgi:hypothetical protein